MPRLDSDDPRVTAAYWRMWNWLLSFSDRIVRINLCEQTAKAPTRTQSAAAMKKAANDILAADRKYHE